MNVPFLWSIIESKILKGGSIEIVFLNIHNPHHPSKMECCENINSVRMNKRGASGVKLVVTLIRNRSKNAPK